MEDDSVLADVMRQVMEMVAGAGPRGIQLSVLPRLLLTRNIEHSSPELRGMFSRVGDRIMALARESSGNYPIAVVNNSVLVDPKHFHAAQSHYGNRSGTALSPSALFAPSAQSDGESELSSSCDDASLIMSCSSEGEAVNAGSVTAPSSKLLLPKAPLPRGPPRKKQRTLDIVRGAVSIKRVIRKKRRVRKKAVDGLKATASTKGSRTESSAAGENGSAVPAHLSRKRRLPQTDDLFNIFLPGEFLFVPHAPTVKPEPQAAQAHSPGRSPVARKKRKVKPTPKRPVAIMSSSSERSTSGDGSPGLGSSSDSSSSSSSADFEPLAVAPVAKDEAKDAFLWLDDDNSTVAPAGGRSIREATQQRSSHGSSMVLRIYKPHALFSGSVRENVRARPGVAKPEEARELADHLHFLMHRHFGARYCAPPQGRPACSVPDDPYDATVVRGGLFLRRARSLRRSARGGPPDCSHIHNVTFGDTDSDSDSEGLHTLAAINNGSDNRLAVRGAAVDSADAAPSYVSLSRLYANLQAAPGTAAYPPRARPTHSAPRAPSTFARLSGASPTRAPSTVPQLPRTTRIHANNPRHSGGQDDDISGSRRNARLKIHHREASLRARW
ncbi:uncharacterized protein AMSG_04515 [Thecamonas trahens ATCC 50062]|uniref:Uncharacterized protein n=1 Tax=Thecamonas trahens ATCC 50062 TaxID=461836 RepID=A0A0L0D7V3_THETB|nr:hypothetical protein AMSG_04515 [Thecamonas trahens ATCC 50062]KNC48285.1 hypothetical protein AMSG_04515 [Thecamonas trahens ATCC 50062]|eukprot:XP_013758852.1 hypothetical protein AMSG_04515 [Thecamonas trahens ATCC 50062]